LVAELSMPQRSWRDSASFHSGETCSPGKVGYQRRRS
jgi:hypothetical protein